jgi:hypothetical protein
VFRGEEVFTEERASAEALQVGQQFVRTVGPEDVCALCDEPSPGGVGVVEYGAFVVVTGVVGGAQRVCPYAAAGALEFGDGGEYGRGSVARYEISNVAGWLWRMNGGHAFPAGRD